MIDKCLHHFAGKKQEVLNIEGMIRDNYRKHPQLIHYADKLHHCTDKLIATLRPDGRYMFTPIYPCGTPFCPLCEQFKNRVKMAQFYQVYNRIQADPGNKTSKFCSLTLTMQHVPAKELRSSIKQLLDGYKKMMRKTQVKKVVHSSSRFLHYGLNDAGYIQPHLHVLLICLPSYHGKNYIKNSHWSELWHAALDYPDYYPIVDSTALGTRGNATQNDFVKMMLYGLKTVKYEDVINHPEAFLSLFEQTRNIRKVAHAGLVRSLKREAIEDYRYQQQQYADDNRRIFIPFDHHQQIYVPR